VREGLKGGFFNATLLSNQVSEDRCICFKRSIVVDDNTPQPDSQGFFHRKEFSELLLKRQRHRNSSLIESMRNPC